MPVDRRRINRQPVSDVLQPQKGEVELLLCDLLEIEHIVGAEQVGERIVVAFNRDARLLKTAGQGVAGNIPTPFKRHVLKIMRRAALLVRLIETARFDVKPYGHRPARLGVGHDGVPEAVLQHALPDDLAGLRGLDLIDRCGSDLTGVRSVTRSDRSKTQRGDAENPCNCP